MPRRKQTQKDLKTQKKTLQKQLPDGVFIGSENPDHALYASDIAAAITADGTGKLSMKMFNKAVDQAKKAVETACLVAHQNLEPMTDKNNSVGFHDKDVWNNFVDTVTALCKHSANEKARQDETESKEFACFLAAVAVELDMTPDQLRPFLGTKPLQITKATYLKKKKSPCLALYQNEVQTQVNDFRRGTGIRLDRLAKDIVARGLTDADVAPPLALNVLEEDKMSTFQITEAYRKEDQCKTKGVEVPSDVRSVILADLDRLIAMCQTTHDKAVAAQQASELMVQYILAVKGCLETLDSNPAYADLTVDQKNTGLKACVRTHEPSTEIPPLIDDAYNSTADASSTRKAAAVELVTVAKDEEVRMVQPATTAVQHETTAVQPEPTSMPTPDTPRGGNTSSSSSSSDDDDDEDDQKKHRQMPAADVPAAEEAGAQPEAGPPDAISAEECQTIRTELFGEADDTPGGGTKREASNSLGRSPNRSFYRDNDDALNDNGW